MKKIILVSNTSWYLFNFRLSIIHFFQSKNFRVICIANIDEYSERLKANGAEFIASTLENKGKNPLSDYAYYKFLYKTYVTLKPDFIFHYTVKPNIYGSIAAKKANIPSIAVVSGAGYVFIHNNLLTTLTKKLYTKAAKSCVEMWFVNSEDQAMFCKAKIVDKEKTKVLPGEGLNTDKFKRKSPFPAGNEKFIFLLAGRMLWDKGVGVFAEAARIVKKKYNFTEFQLLGFIDDLNPSAIPKKEIDDWVKEGIVNYLGATDNVQQYLEKINCFVLPSYYREGVPKSLLEAASLEIPIITTNNVGCREVVEDGYNGLLCEVKNVEDLSEKLERMIATPKEKLRVMGSNGRKKVIAEFNEDLVLNYYNKAYNKYFKK